MAHGQRLTSLHRECLAGVPRQRSDFDTNKPTVQCCYSLPIVVSIVCNRMSRLCSIRAILFDPLSRGGARVNRQLRPQSDAEAVARGRPLVADSGFLRVTAIGKAISP